MCTYVTFLYLKQEILVEIRYNPSMGVNYTRDIGTEIEFICESMQNFTVTEVWESKCLWKNVKIK
jgi:hypothetical protein